MYLFALALKSLVNRRITASLTVLAIALSVTLLLGVEKMRTEAKASFASTISSTDLIVGARSGSIPLLLYAVFRIGNATNNIAWDSYQYLARNPQVAWTIPLSLGDSHRGFRVLGTTKGYFEHYRFGPKRSLVFAHGGPFEDLFDAVVGADVARELGYRLGQPIVVAHGAGAAEFSRHDDKPFRIAGILAKTGTPVDRTVHIGLEAIEAIHVDWRGGARMPGHEIGADAVRRMDLSPKAITAFLVGLKSKTAVFAMQRRINEYKGEPLLAVLPGVALQELWNLMGTAEAALVAVSGFVVMTGVLGMLTMMLAGMNERRREMAILRSVGARPAQIFFLFVAEAATLTALGIALGLALLYLVLLGVQPIVDSGYGLYIPITPPADRDWAVIGLVFLAGTIAGFVPAYRAYRQSLADGMIVRT